MFEIRNVTREFKTGKKNKKVLNDITLSFHSGNLIAIYGASGSGKTTLLNIIGSLDKNYNGLMINDNKYLDVTKSLEVTKYRMNEVGFVHQTYNLLKHLSVRDNILVSTIICKNDEILTDYERLIEVLELKELENETVNNLSGGEKQRVAIARALIRNPNIVLADEPTGALDYENSKNVLGTLQKIAKEDNRMVLVVTHDPIIDSYCDRKIILRDGKVLEDIINNTYIKSNEYIKNRTKSEKISFNWVKSIKFSIDSWLNKKSLALFLVIATSISLVSFFLMFCLGNGVNQIFSDELNGMFDSTSITVTKALTDSQIFFTSTDIDVINEMENITYVQKTMEYEVDLVRTEWNNEEVTEISISNQNAVLPAEYRSIYIDNYLIEGRYIEKGSNEVIVNEALARQLTEGKSISNLIGKEITVNISVIEPLNANYEFRSYDKEEVILQIVGIVSDSPITSQTFAISQEYILDIYTEVSGNSLISSSMLNIIVDDSKNVSKVQNELDKQGFLTFSNQNQINEVQGLTKGIEMIFLLIGVVSLVVSIFMIGVTVYTNIFERRKEIGVLKTLGFKNKHITNIFLTENIIMGIIVSLFSLLEGMVMVLVLNKIMEGKIFEEGYKLFVFDIKALSYVFIIAIIMYSLGSIFPVRNAVKKNPAYLLKTE